MVNPTKKIGTQHETDIVNWLRANGWPHADRRPPKGGKDRGDVQLSERVPFTIEAKTARKTTDRMTVSTWLRELAAEIENAGDISGAVVYKQRGTVDVGEYVVLMRMKHLQTLLTRAFAEHAAQCKETLTSELTPPRRRVIPRYE